MIIYTSFIKLMILKKKEKRTEHTMGGFTLDHLLWRFTDS